MKNIYKYLFWAIVVVVIHSCKNEEVNNAGKRPNILFCISDDQSFPHAGAYGTHWVKTPAFDRIAKKGILFTNAYTCNAKCAPSRSSIVTGRNSWQLEEAANHWPYFPAKFKTYGEVLSENGYHVGYTGKGWAPGVALDSLGNKRQLVGPVYNEYFKEPPTRGMYKFDYARNFEAFLDVNKGNPFCFWYGGIEPHRPYEYGTGTEIGGKSLEEIKAVPDFWPNSDSVRNDILDYALEIEYFDLHLSKMLEILEERGLLDNTLVIVTSDNGMPFPRSKGHCYEFSNHVPLAMMWKNGLKNPGRTIDGYVSLTDFAPTFLDLVDVDQEECGMAPMEGQSLLQILNDEQISTGREFMIIGKERTDVSRPDDQGYPTRGIIKNGFLYLYNFKLTRWPAGNPEIGYMDTGSSPTKTEILKDRREKGESKYWDLNFGKRPSEELYNITEDPGCIDNLAFSMQYQELKKEMKSLMFEELKSEGDPRMFGNGDVFDNYSYSDEKNKNFYNRFMNGEKLDADWIDESDFDKDIIE